MSAPKLTVEQRQAALAKARDARKKRADVMEGLRSGKTKHVSVIAKRKDPIIGRIKISAFLATLPGVGAAKAATIMNSCDIAENRRLSGLGKRQAEKLVETIESVC